MAAGHVSENTIPIDHFLNGGQIKYSFVLTLISLSSLFQKNICFKMRKVGLINIKTKDCKSGLCEHALRTVPTNSKVFLRVLLNMQKTSVIEIQKEN